MANVTMNANDYWTNEVYSDSREWWWKNLDCDATDLACLQRWNIIHVAAIIPTIGSVLCSIYIIITGTMYHFELRNLGFAAQLPVFISICDLLFEMGHGSDHTHNLIVGYVSEGFLCQLFGCIKPFSINCQTAWALGTAYFLSHTIMRGEPPTFGPKNLYIHLPCWGIPFIVMIIGFIYDVYGIEGPWCGIKNPTVDFFMADLWVALAVVILIIGYSATGWYLRRMMTQHFNGENEIDQENYIKGRSNISKSIRILGLYPIAYVFQWLAYGLLKTGTIPLTYNNVLWVVTTANTGGMLNFFIYYPLLLNQVKRKWSQKSTNSRMSLNPSYAGSNGGSRSRGGSRANSPRVSKKLVPQKSLDIHQRSHEKSNEKSSENTLKGTPIVDITPKIEDSGVKVTLDVEMRSRSVSEA